MKMFLTRLGEDSKMIVTGDPTQIDLQPGEMSGLNEATRILDGVESIAIVRFTGADVVRHPLVQRIVEAYERDERGRRKRRDDRRFPLRFRAPPCRDR